MIYLFTYLHDVNQDNVCLGIFKFPYLLFHAERFILSYQFKGLILVDFKKAVGIFESRNNFLLKKILCVIIFTHGVQKELFGFNVDGVISIPWEDVRNQNLIN